ncbi:aspartate-semialdehyde dehydrogenase related protein [Thermoplasma acidophilum]|uniref:Aspartate-semialdehyde dehydrogenase related protein n=1 Tax=Thermoplasma acidophilum (strain ATCC 25905 / DSM 1728 / JCM 9062 / NBRC 15155 / AMRC-C165) TaxID=273075 RepID=Q9HL68_THEAC|nr:aspartate-semialdehyde dehydrogenase [Thermoplasma acidophilum]MCY0851372.1 aspartate-semialdehyde dehydrogenase [Thermoplasma acidophilum]CAC11507.1 aspartate-semialdehyde dehydrogenase related protein [Thermoplasma acidophilum]
MDKLRVGLLGSTGVVGSLLSKMIAIHPYFDLANVYASDRSAGQRYGNVVYGGASDLYRNLEVKESNPDRIISDHNDIIFSAVSDEKAGLIERRLAEAGLPIFTNASANRLEDDVFLIVPEINGDLVGSIKRKGFIIANGNCSTIGLALGIDPVIRGRSAVKIIVTTMQAVSGAGYPGVSSLDIIDNMIPYIQKEETKIERETKKIFSGKLDTEIFATTTRVPVKIGHMESVHIEFDQVLDPSEIRAEFRSYGNGLLKTVYPSLPDRSVILLEKDDRPQPALDATNGGSALKAGMAVSVGRLRVRSRSLDLVLLVNNLVRGAAGSTLLNAEIAYKEGII